MPNYLIEIVNENTNTVIDQMVVEYEKAREFMKPGHRIYAIQKGLSVNEHNLLVANGQKPSYPLL
jgi:hypothetical protein